MGLTAMILCPSRGRLPQLTVRFGLCPYAISNQVLYYNKDMFREVGLDPEKPPTNWDELIEYGKLLTRDVTGDGKVDEWGLTFPLKADEGGVYYYITHLWQAGGELYNEDFTAVAFNDEFGEKAAQFWWDLLHEHEITPLAPPAQGFQTGRIAMELGTSARLAAHLEQVTFELGIAHMPSDEVKVTGLGGGNLAIFQKQPREAGGCLDLCQVDDKSGDQPEVE